MAVEDAEAAYAHPRETTGFQVALAAAGAGARIALALARAHPEVRRVVLIAPGAAPGARPPARVLVVLPETGAPPDQSVRELAGPEGKVEVVAASDATWRSGLPALAKATVAWLEAPRGRRRAARVLHACGSPRRRTPLRVRPLHHEATSSRVGDDRDHLPRAGPRRGAATQRAPAIESPQRATVHGSTDGR